MKLLTIPIILSLLLFPVSNDNEKIAWSADKKLTWADFKGDPAGGNGYVASTNSGISFSYSFAVREGELKLSHTVRSKFYPNLSWFMPGHVDDYILKHEQTHFDISELYARKLRKQLEETQFTLEPKETLDAIYSQAETRRRAMQKRFDEESDHSKIEGKEYQWEAYVAQELKKYEAWK